MAAATASVMLAGCGNAGRSVHTASPAPTQSTALVGASTPPAPAGAVPPTTAVPGQSGGQGPTVSSPPIATTPSTTTVKTAPTTRPPSQGMIQLTSADTNRTFAVSRGQTVQLTLSDEGTQWGQVQEAPTGLLSPNPAPTPPPHGQLVIWTARNAGTVKVSAIGTAYCAAGTACPMYARLFDLTLVIS